MTPHEGFWRRLGQGTRWSWIGSKFQAALPADLDDVVMTLESRDRLHAKQGRSTARVVFHGPDGPLPVYLKRHYTLPWTSRLLALLHPRGGYTPGAAEFAHLHARGPWGFRCRRSSRPASASGLGDACKVISWSPN